MRCVQTTTHLPFALHELNDLIMKRYIKNLIIAILGRDPYLEEFEEVCEKYDMAAANIASLRDMYYNALNRWSDECKNVRQLQNLVENLRSRIKEKDEIIKQIEQRLNSAGSHE